LTGFLIRTRGNPETMYFVSRPPVIGTVIRTNPLPPEYRVCVRVGYANFGDGIAGPGRLNGYLGGETDPWRMCDPIKDNGFYWLAILDDLPPPRPDA